MSLHETNLVWERDPSLPFDYDHYTRDHRVSMQTGLVLPISAAVDYKGNPERTNPEELLVAALSSCHMLTFLAICAKKGIVVDRYEDQAVGTLSRPAGAPMSVTTCTLKPRVTFAEGHGPDREALAKLHEQAHKGCFIANSVKTEVSIDLG